MVSSVYTCAFIREISCTGAAQGVPNYTLPLLRYLNWGGGAPNYTLPLLRYLNWGGGAVSTQLNPRSIFTE